MDAIHDFLRASRAERAVHLLQFPGVAGGVSGVRRPARSARRVEDTPRETRGRPGLHWVRASGVGHLIKYRDGDEACSVKIPLAADTIRRRRGTMASDAVVELRDMIVFGAILPGTALRLEEVARVLDMSISPVREAIRQLEMMGLVEHAPYRGARVTELDADEMFEVYEARLALETLAVRRVAACSDDAGVALLQAAFDDLVRSYDTHDARAIVRGNTAFHEAMAVASQSRWLARLIRPTLEISERFSAATVGRENEEETRAIERAGHEEILEACRAHDPDEAAAALTRHLRVFEDLFRQEMKTTARRPG